MDLRLGVIFFSSLVASAVVHEVSHGVAALWLGDDTAKQAGRLTLNPIPHLDPFGSVLLPALGVLSGLPVLAFAKPVPVRVDRLHKRPRDVILVSLAGPTSNLLMMLVGAVAARAVYGGLTVSPLWRDLRDFPPLFQLTMAFALVNLFLGIFNLLPIPPLDGSAILEPVLPERWRATWYRIRPYGLLIVFALVFWTGIVGRVLDPFERTLIDFVTGR